MKKVLLTLVMLLSFATVMDGQTYTVLWRQVKDAEQNDLPRSQYEVLMKIVQKAHAEQQAGQLMKAELQAARVMATIAPDSLLPAVERMEQRMNSETDVVLKTIYQVVLRRVFRDNSQLERMPAEVKLTPEICQSLSRVKAVDYEPLTIRGVDSRLFDDDLLSVVGYELEDFQPLTDYYAQVGNRRAALLTAVEACRRQRPGGRVQLRKSDYLQRVDSLIRAYGDLVECGEAAIERYQYMSDYTDATVEERWQYINYALDRWGGWQQMNVLRNAQREMTASQFHASTDWKVNIPHREQTFKLSRIRNIRQLTMRLYKVDAQGDLKYDVNSEEGYRKLKPLLTLLPMTQTRQYVGKREYEAFEDSLVLPALPEGVYMVEMESQPATEVARQLYFVSHVRVLMEGLPDKQMRYVVVDAVTGQPLPDASLRLTTYQGQRQENTTLKTDAKGETIYHYVSQRPHQVFAYTKNDPFCPPSDGRTYFNYYNRQQHAEQIQIMTDRAIYRPGQTVHAAVVAYETDNGYEHRSQAGKSLTLTLRDANWKVVGEKQLTTDRFGVCSADFTLPANLLNGSFTLQAEGSNCWLRVEEYKRPTFEVTFPEVNQHYEDGDTVQVRATAKSYSGVPVQGARVSYRVVRRQSWWWLSYSRYWQNGMTGRSSADEEVARGEAVTGADGTFMVDMPMTLPPSLHPMFYQFVCTADVTSQSGETRQAQLSLPLGNRTTAFSCDMPDKLLLESPSPVVFHLRNAAGVDIATSLRYRIDDGKWQTATSNTSILLAKLSSGRHTLEAICEQDTLKQSFIAFSLSDKRPAADTRDWFFLSATEFPRDGKPVTVQVGSSDPDVHIVYSIISGQQVLECGAVNRSGELVNRQLKYKEEYGNGLLLTYAWVKDGICYHHEATIRRPLPDKHLQLSWTTFRDRLTPGQKEEWSLAVIRPDGTPADAHLIATLYDKSLDQLQQHQWSFSPYLVLPLPETRWLFATWSSLGLNGYKQQSWLKNNPLDFTHFDDAAFPTMWMGRAQLVFAAQSRGMKMKRVAMASDGDADEVIGAFDSAMPVNEAKQLEKSAPAMAAKAEAEDLAPDQPVQLRENLQETAFFYPQLVTDGTGRVVLKFTLPESLTTWRFMGLAHTTDLCYGMLEGEAVAQKEVMIQPNMPRFVREADDAVISAQLVNLSTKKQQGTARLILVNPETDKIVFQAAVPVQLPADTTVSVSFRCKPRASWPSLLVCRMLVSGQGFSDGEQHYLPVLSSRELVTVTLPFSQNGPGVKTVDLSRLFPEHLPTALSHSSKLTFEYTNNPAWLMVQALPAVGQPSDDNALSQAASLYANTLGQYLIHQMPQSKQVFERWQRESSQEKTLHSQLQKNAALRDILLSETPWVADADQETEQRQRLADFFDDNLMQQRLSQATEKLKALQRADGAWSWWPGMPASTLMTATISEMLVRLQSMTGTTQPMLDNAFRYLGREMVDMVSEMKKHERKGHRQVFPSHVALQWLYLCKLDGRRLPADVAEANKYLTTLLKKETKNQTIYEKAMSAIILDSPSYVKSLKEYTVYSDELGRYYDTPRAGYSWRDYRIPTQVAAMEAMLRLTPDDVQTVDEMRRWLLQEKRTQAWDTPVNSVDAVYAFMLGVNLRETLGTDSQSQLTIDGKPVDLQPATAGLGYVKTTQPYRGEKTFAAKKSTEGTSWGAVYAQFLQPTADIRDSNSGLAVKRELLTLEGEPVTALRVGSRVRSRLTITADRDYDFVQLVDRRAACLEPVSQLSGYRGGYYVMPRDHSTNYYFDRLPKGKHVVETEYYVDRPGSYETGTCTAQCAYAPEFRATTSSKKLQVKDE